MNPAKTSSSIPSSAQDEDALVDTMNRVFDLNIDGWFRVNFSSVITIIDAMGGVEIESDRRRGALY